MPSTDPRLKALRSRARKRGFMTRSYELWGDTRYYLALKGRRVRADGDLALLEAYLDRLDAADVPPPRLRRTRWPSPRAEAERCLNR
jgi:hypothetical protein